MPAVTIRNLPDETHRALKLQAAMYSRSAEAEMRAILEAAVRPDGRLRIGAALSAIGQKHGVTKVDVEALEKLHDTHPPEPIRFK